MLKVMPRTPEEKRGAVKRHPIKFTALLYLRDALRREQYEKCAEIISVAEEFGAKPFEIRDLLEDQRRSPG